MQSFETPLSSTVETCVPPTAIAYPLATQYNYTFTCLWILQNNFAFKVLDLCLTLIDFCETKSIVNSIEYRIQKCVLFLDLRNLIITTVDEYSDK